MSASKTAGGGEGGAAAREAPDVSEAPGDGGERPWEAVWDPEAIVARVRERELQRRPVLEAIAGQARERAAELAGWGLERSWPFSRLREAWVVARHGATAAADSGPAGAGPLYPDDYARLRRAVARYERNQHRRAATGIPPAGSARCCTSARSPAAASCPADRAPCATPSARSISSPGGCGRSPPPTAPHAATVPLSALGAGASPRRGRCSSPSGRNGRRGSLTDHDGNPVFDRLGMLELDPDARCGVPSASSEHYRSTSATPTCSPASSCPSTSTGASRWRCATRGSSNPPSGGRPRRSKSSSCASSRTAPASRSASCAASAPAYRAAWLADRRQQDAQRARAEILAFKQQIATIRP